MVGRSATTVQVKELRDCLDEVVLSISAPAPPHDAVDHWAMPACTDASRWAVQLDERKENQETANPNHNGRPDVRFV